MATATIDQAVRFTCDKRELAAGLAWAAKGLPARPAVPILAGMLVEVSNGLVTLAAFDYDMMARAHVAAIGYYTSPAEGRDGVVLVRGHELLKAVKGLPSRKGARVTAEVTIERALTVSCDGVTATAEILPLEEYPQLPGMPPSAGVMESGAFAAAVARVVPAASRDDTLPTLTCVSLVTDGGEIHFAATDRYRAAFEAVAWTPAGTDDCPWHLNIPGAALAMFGKAATKNGKIALHLGEAQLPHDGQGSIPPMVGFSDGTHELITRTNDGEFPNMGRFVAGLGDIHASADADGPALAAALKRAGATAQRGEPVHLKVTREGITVTVWRDDEVASRETVPGTLETDATENGRQVCGFKAAYNPAYLHSMVAGVAGTVRLSWSALGKPVQVSEADSAGGFRAIVMPIRTPAR